MHINYFKNTILRFSIFTDKAMTLLVRPVVRRWRKITSSLVIFVLATLSINAAELDVSTNTWNKKIYSNKNISANDVAAALAKYYNLNTAGCDGDCNAEIRNNSIVCWNEAANQKVYSMDLFQTANSLLSGFMPSRSMEDILSASPSYTPFGSKLNQLKLIEANCSKATAAGVRSFLTDIYRLKEMYIRDLNDKSAEKNTALRADRDRKYAEGLNDKCTAAGVTIQSYPECGPILKADLMKERANRERRTKIETDRRAVIKNRIDGYRDFKFGLEKRTVEGLNNSCNEYHPWDDVILNGFRCYNIAGEKRDIRFTFGKQGLSDIEVYLSLFDEAVNAEISKSLTGKYRVSYTPSNYIKSLFDSGKIKYIPIHAFEDWSIIYVATKDAKGRLFLSLLYLTDERAAIVKAKWLSRYSSQGDEVKRVKAGDV